MKQLYQEAVIKVILLESDDIITTSGEKVNDNDGHWLPNWNGAA